MKVKELIDALSRINPEARLHFVEIKTRREFEIQKGIAITPGETIKEIDDFGKGESLCLDYELIIN